MPLKVKELISLIKKDEWYLSAQVGSPRQSNIQTNQVKLLFRDIRIAQTFQIA